MRGLFLTKSIDNIIGCHEENDFHIRKSGRLKSADGFIHMHVVHRVFYTHSYFA